MKQGENAPRGLETLANIITLANPGSEGEANELLYAFVNSPLDMKPAHPSKCFPLTYRAQTKGFYLFRNRWQDADDILFLLYANPTDTRGHSQENAAAIRFYGLRAGTALVERIADQGVG